MQDASPWARGLTSNLTLFSIPQARIAPFIAIIHAPDKRIHSYDLSIRPPGGGCLCDLYVLLHTAAARPDSPDYSACAFDRNSSAKDYDPRVVGRIEPEALLPALRKVRQVIGRHVKCSCGPGLVDRNIDAAEPCAVHTHVRYESAAGVSHGDVVRDSQFNRFAFAGCDDLPCVGKVQGQGWSRHVKLLRWHLTRMRSQNSEQLD